MSPFWIYWSKDDGDGGDNWSYKMSKALDKIITTNKPTPSFFSQAGCPSCRPTDSVKALNGQLSLFVIDFFRQ